MDKEPNIPVTITAEGSAKACDLLLVMANNKSYLLEAPPGKAKVGDLVEFIPVPNDMTVGFVDDILATEEYSDLYCFVGRMANIWKPRVIYNKGWVDPKLYDDVI